MIKYGTTNEAHAGIPNYSIWVRIPFQGISLVFNLQLATRICQRRQIRFFKTFQFVEIKSGAKKINISQRNECITSCPQIYVRFEGNFNVYSILDNKEYQRLKNDVEQFLVETKGY